MADGLSLVLSDSTQPAFVLSQLSDTEFTLTEKDTTTVSFNLTTTEAVGNVSLRGPQGLPGSAVAEYTHDQSVAASTWTVNHNLNRKPASVSVLSPGGMEVEATITHINENQLTIGFSLPYTGSARIN